MVRIIQKKTEAITSQNHPDEELDFRADCGTDVDAWGVGVGVGFGGTGFGGAEAAF